MKTQLTSTSLHAKTLNCYVYAGSSFFTAGLGEGPKKGKVGTGHPFHQPPRKNIYAYAGSSFFTAGLGEGPKNASGITDEWW